MIKSIILKNFEAHEDTTINFNDNLNLIVGLSNSGKSSIIRSMGVIVNNNWTKDMVRTGCDFCYVKLETEKGWVEAERGEKINRWRCQLGDEAVQSFKNVGTTVPDLATKILGMGERDRGGDIKELPNFQFQLEKHYMLSEIGEKKATSNMIARMMDNAIGLGGMEDLIKAISTDLVKDKKWLTEKQNEITELKSSIIDESIFNGYEKAINNINELSNKLNDMEKDIEDASVYHNKYTKTFDELNIAKSNLESFNELSHIINLKDEMIQLNDKINKAEKVNEIKDNLMKQDVYTNMDISYMQKSLNEVVDLKKEIDLCNKIIQTESLLKEKSKIADFDFNVIDNVQKELNQLNDKIDKAQKLLISAREIWKNRVNSEKQLKSDSKELNDLELQFHELKDKMGVCPLCGGKL